MRHLPLLSLAVLLGAAATESPAMLVKKLTDQDASLRAHTRTKLVELGEKAIPALTDLEKATSNVEVRQRAKSIREEIETRLRIDRLPEVMKDVHFRIEQQGEPVGYLRLTTSLEKDEESDDERLIFEDEMHLAVDANKSMSFRSKVVCKKDLTLTPLTAESTGEGSPIFPTYTSEMKDGKIVVTQKVSKQELAAPAGFLPDSAALRWLAVRPLKKKGTQERISIFVVGRKGMLGQSLMSTGEATLEEIGGNTKEVVPLTLKVRAKLSPVTVFVGEGAVQRIDLAGGIECHPTTGKEARAAVQEAQELLK